MAGEDDRFLVFPAKSAVFAENFGVMGIPGFPSQCFPEIVDGGLLDEFVFSVVVAHNLLPHYSVP